MGSGVQRSTRALVVLLVFAATVGGGVAAGATTRDDGGLVRAGVLVASDFPAGFTASAPSGTAPSGTSHTDNLRLAKGVEGCAPYAALQKALASLPQARSSSFGDGARTVSNEVDAFPSGRLAANALATFAKSSVAGCLEHLFEKQLRQAPDVHASVDDVVATLDRQDIAGLGDESVVYEGHVTLTATDGSSQQLGVGTAVVRVGRVVDAVQYSTTGASPSEVVSPAVDASVARLRAALARSAP